MSKKVLLLANAAFTISNFRIELIEGLKKKGFDVYIICPKGESKSDEALKRVGASVIPIKVNRNGMNPLSDLLYFFNLFKLLCDLKPDFILNYTIKPLLYGSLSSLFLKYNVKVMSNITGVGYVFSGMSFKQKAIRAVILPFLRFALKRNDVVFFQNEDDYQLYNRYNLLSDNNTIEVLNGSGVNLRKFKPRVDSYSKVTFIFVGRFMKDKGVFNFIETARLLKRKYDSSISFMMFGKIDSNPESLSQTVIDGLINDNIFDRICATDDIYEVLKKNSVLVLPSYREGTPKSVLEGLACGLPIITTNAPGCRETVIEGFNGFLIPVNDTEQLILKCEQLIKDVDLREHLGSNSRILAERKFDVNLVNKSILKYVE